MPTILAQCQENFRKAKETRKAVEEAEKKRKANEDAERRRKAMEDKRAAEDQERKKKAEQDRKNTEDTERLRNEEAERRRRNKEAQGDECSCKSFLNCKPSEFYRDSDPVIVTNWLREIEDIFEIREQSSTRRRRRQQKKERDRDDDMKKAKISGEKAHNASEYKPCTICNKTHKGKCWHEDCRNCGKPRHATKDCKADWVCF
ncbi:zinc finger, CCHC-type, retrotransposon gag domain protein [Tanacetum coccineum]